MTAAHCLAVVGTLFLILGKSGCFANDSEAETGGMVHNIQSTWTGVSSMPSLFVIRVLILYTIGCHCGLPILGTNSSWSHLLFSFQLFVWTFWPWHSFSWCVVSSFYSFRANG
jgi:hypothetical protein